MAKFHYIEDKKQYHYACPGCECYHFITVDKSQTPNWSFNGDIEKPTVSPSVRVRYGNEPDSMVCHFFIREGFYEYCPDSTHKYSGQKIEIPDWES